MKPEYKRENLKITEFDTEDVITTSGKLEPVKLMERENRYGSFGSFDFDQAPGSWF